LLNPDMFAQWMKTAPKDLQIGARLLTVFKTFWNETRGNYDVLMPEPPIECALVGTMLRDSYARIRRTSQDILSSPLLLMHFAWGRERAELEQKLANWGHSKDFDTGKFLALWDSVTLENYETFKELHPLDPPKWPRLAVVAVNDLPGAPWIGQTDSRVVLPGRRR